MYYLYAYKCSILFFAFIVQNTYGTHEKTE